MVDKLGDTFANTSMVTPLNARPGKAEPGPPILNNPLIQPSDFSSYLTEAVKPGKKNAIAGGNKTQASK